jgi:signal transduction histidine kinase/DNA-binding response OmpR family regulator/HPt (histidine-containing phosphotransfer) domain-containing protein
METGKEYSGLFFRFFSESGAAFFITDSRGKVLFSNDSFGKILDGPGAAGKSADEIFDFGNAGFGGFFSGLIEDGERFLSFGFSVSGTPSGSGDGGVRLRPGGLFRRAERESTARWFTVHVWRVDSGPPGPFLAFSMEDRTRAREEEQKLLKSQEDAEKAVEARNQFLANMSHEIRTPIQTIIGMTELLQDTRLDREQAEYSRQIKFSADVLLTLINDILDYSKIGAGKMELECTDFNLEETIEQAVEMVSLEAHKKGLEIAMDIPRKAAVVIKGDPGKFRQIVINLAKNAVKFTKEGGVTISARIAGIKGRPGEWISVSVADTGIGIDEETRKRLFSTFMQADVSTTRRFGGTGLGLAISRSLVELMGGFIEMIPNEGGGSVFRFAVPLKRSGISPVPLPPVPDEKYRILVIDDKPEPRRIISSYLEDIGYTDIDQASSGEEALEMMRAARGNPFTLCFIDSLMPVMDGWRLAAEIHNDPDINGANLILMVPHGMLGADTKMTLMKWFRAYINKPVKRRNLADTIYLTLGEGVDELEAAEGEAGEVRDGTSEPAGDAEKAGERLSKPLVMIVEDHPVNRKLFAMFVEKLGYPYVLAGDGLEALEKAGADPALVFMDIQMPRMNGYEAAGTLRKQGFRRPVIAVTASALPDERERCAAAGFDDILIKPFRRPDLELMLDKWIGLCRDQPARELPGQAAAPVPAAGAASPSEVFDSAELLAVFLDEEETAKSLLGQFLERTEGQINALPGLVEKGDWETARREAHTIKGSSFTLCGRELGRTAEKLELACKNADGPGAEAACVPLTLAFRRFRDAANAYLEAGS